MMYISGELSHQQSSPRGTRSGHVPYSSGARPCDELQMGREAGAGVEKQPTTPMDGDISLMEAIQRAENWERQCAQGATAGQAGAMSW